MNTDPERARGDAGGDAIEAALRDMTVWKEPLPSPALWERAAAGVDQEHAAAFPAHRRWPRPLRIPGSLAAALAIAAIGVFVLAIMPSLDAARVHVSSLPRTEGPAPSAAPIAAPASDAAFTPPASIEEHARKTGQPTPLAADALAPAARSVIRKATIELKAPDVRVAAHKALLLLNEAGGEFAQESSVRGDGEHATAQLVLRVAASRLSTVLDDLRVLGEVTNESATGADVTGQVVDLEARLRNERRIETELLELLEKRHDAPLEEILQLREQIARVRGEVERLTAQRDHLSRLVSLATVLVVIRAGDAPLRAEGSMLSYLGDQLSAAWRGGIRALSDTLAVLVWVIVGGLVWWVLAAAVAVVGLRAAARRRSERTDPHAAP